MKYWLVKSEPEAFSISDLAKAPKQTSGWDGVRNYQARNFLKAMQAGDRVLFYHSGTGRGRRAARAAMNPATAVVGVATVARAAYPDASAWDKKNDHFDAKASPANPIWQMVDIRLEEIFPRPVTLEELRGVKALADMVLLKKGRLSVQPVTKGEFEMILKLGHKAVATGASPAAQPPATRRNATGPSLRSAPATRTPTKKKTAKRAKGK